MDLKEQYFGTEIEMTGITREEAANAVGELFGTQPYYIGTYYSTWGVRDLEGKEWKFTYDGSIHTQPPVECMFMWMPPIIHHEV